MSPFDLDVPLAIDGVLEDLEKFRRVGEPRGFEERRHRRVLDVTVQDRALVDVDVFPPELLFRTDVRADQALVGHDPDPAVAVAIVVHPKGVLVAGQGHHFVIPEVHRSVLADVYAVTECCREADLHVGQVGVGGVETLG